MPFRPDPLPKGWHNFRATLEYDGSFFSGFQRQPGRLTVQEAFEESLSNLFNMKLKIGSASGRTDAGVHAEGQVVHFFAPDRFPSEQMLRAINTRLPEALVVRSLSKSPHRFHARFSAKRKVYEYRIWNSPNRSPLNAAQSAHVKFELNFDAMKRAAKKFLGKHDFRSFCATDPEREDQDTRRTIYRLDLRKRGALLTLQVEADGFLYHMVRNIAGTLMDVGRGKLQPQDMTRILSSKDRRQAGATAPAQGLKLVKVIY